MSKTRLFQAIFIEKSWIKSFNNGIVYIRLKKNWFLTLLENCFQTKHSVLFTIFLPEQVHLEGQWHVAISEISYTSINQNIAEWNLEFFDEKRSKSTTTYNLEPGLYTSTADIVEAINTLLQERNNHKETCITVEFSRRTQKVVNMLANDTSGLAYRSTELGHTFGNNVGNEFGYWW